VNKEFYLSFCSYGTLEVKIAVYCKNFCEYLPIEIVVSTISMHLPSVGIDQGILKGELSLYH
jgi:hypothetical protein